MSEFFLNMTKLSRIPILLHIRCFQSNQRAL